MNEEMKAIIKEEAEKYAMHYVGDFITMVYKGRITSFEDHFASLKFGDDFYGMMVYGEYPFVDYMNEERPKLLQQIKNEVAAKKVVEQFEHALIAETSRVFKEYFVAVYQDRLSSDLPEYEEELQYAVEDAVYYKERRYIGEEDQIGGEVSEEERLSLIEEAERNQEKLTVVIDRMRDIQKEFAPYIAVQI